MTSEFHLYRRYVVNRSARNTHTYTLPPNPLMLQPASESEDVLRAVHESAHGCVALALDVHVSFLTMQPRAGRDGYDACAMIRTGDIDIDRAITISLAGPVAELYQFPLLADPDLQRGDAGDVHNVMQRLSARYGADHTSPVVRAALERLALRTHRLVLDHWSWITRTAIELARWRLLSGQEISQLREHADA